MVHNFKYELIRIDAIKKRGEISKKKTSKKKTKMIDDDKSQDNNAKSYS